MKEHELPEDTIEQVRSLMPVSRRRSAPARPGSPGTTRQFGVPGLGGQLRRDRPAGVRRADVPEVDVTGRGQQRHPPADRRRLADLFAQLADGCPSRRSR